MRTALRLLGTRYGIAAALLVLVLAVVGVGRVMAGSHPADPIGPVIAPPSTLGADPSRDLEPGDDSLVEPDGKDVSPSLSPNTADVSTVASHFITAWLRHTDITAEQWRTGLIPNATPDLMKKLQDTDPGSVPANTITGSVAVADQGGSVWSAAIQVNGGVVTLRLISLRGHWLVDGVDWDPS